jgi:hypothetical protein
VAQPVGQRGRECDRLVYAEGGQTGCGAPVGDIDTEGHHVDGVPPAELGHDRFITRMRCDVD